MKNILLGAIGLGAVFGVLAWFGLTPFKEVNTVVQQMVGSASGTTFNSAKVAQINLNPQSITSTSTSLYNGDSSDRIVTDAFVSCNNLTSMTSATGGVATFQWGAATTTAAAPTASVLTNQYAAMNVTVATSTADGYTATSTYTAAASRRWAAGSYMTFQTNATSTNAACTVGVHYLGT